LPEFPLIPIKDFKEITTRKQEIEASLEFGKTFQTAQADFICIPKDKEANVLLIEFKTDVNSAVDDQLKRYRILNNRKWKELAGVFLGKMVSSSEEKTKYEKYVSEFGAALPDFDKIIKNDKCVDVSTKSWVNKKIKEEILTRPFDRSECHVEVVYVGPEGLKNKIGNDIFVMEFNLIKDVLKEFKENKKDPKNELATLLLDKVIPEISAETIETSTQEGNLYCPRCNTHITSGLIDKLEKHLFGRTGKGHQVKLENLSELANKIKEKQEINEKLWDKRDL
jgi:hypothetical protein